MGGMTIKEVIDAYITKKGIVRISGEGTDISPIFPLIIMDSALQLFEEHIEPIECKQEMKRLKKEWLEHYRSFNMDFFRCLNPEQTDFVCDMMDAFEDHIKHDLTIAFYSFTNILKMEVFERQKVLAASMLIGVLCQSANIIYGRVYRSRSMGESSNRNIFACEKIIHRWSNLYYGNNTPLINPNNNEQLCLAVDILCRKEIDFMRKYD